MEKTMSLGIQTSCYSKVPPGPRAICISRGMPRGKQYKRYWPLAPGPWFKSVDEAEYRRRYFAQLDGFDPVDIICDLYALTNQQRVILLCYEQPGQFCHRRLFAEWVNQQCPYWDIPEL